MSLGMGTLSLCPKLSWTVTQLQYNRAALHSFMKMRPCFQSSFYLTGYYRLFTDKGVDIGLMNHAHQAGIFRLNDGVVVFR